MDKLYIRSIVYPIDDYLPEKNIADSPLQNRLKDWLRQYLAQITLTLAAAAVTGLTLWFGWFVVSIFADFADANNLEWLQHHWVNLLIGVFVLIAVGRLADGYLQPIGGFLSAVITSSCPLAFDAAQWQSASYRNDSNDPKDTARVQMVDDLLRQYDFVGLPSTDVFALLGQPTEVSLFSEWDILYFLGPEPGLFSMSHLWLGFQLDAQQRVTNCQVVSD